MDRKFYTDDFERLIKEMSDEFRMYPSKRIWNSIYNNIHPQRKWPSIGMSISLIFTLILVGHLNTSNPVLVSQLASKQLAYQNAPFNLANAIAYSSKFPDHSIGYNQTNISPLNDLESAAIVNQDKLNNNQSGPYHQNITSNKKASSKVIDNNTLANHEAIAQIQSLSKKGNQNLNKSIQSLSNSTKHSVELIAENSSSEIASEPSSSIATSQKSNISDLMNSISENEISRKELNSNFSEALQNKITSLIQKRLSKNNQALISMKDKEWVENIAVKNKKVAKKWAGKITSMAYFTPSIVYRSLSNNPDFFTNNSSSSPVSLSTANQALKENLNQLPAIGLEIGAGLQYSILKNLSIKGGVQLNYTRYSTNAFANSHPFSTAITLHDFVSNTNYEIYKTSPFSNKAGLEATRLHNETFQFSLPVGANLKLAGNEKLQWNIGAAIQPTFVVGGKNYLISSDYRNFVNEPSLFRRWNLNAGFETFITFKSKGLSWQIGPQFRTQLLSTNSKQYVIEEKLLNYGLKVGVSKIIR